MIKICNTEAQRHIYLKVATTLDEITPIAGEKNHNMMCYKNAVNYAIKNDQKYVLLGFYVYNECPVVHFYNVDKNGDIIDNTLGNGVDFMTHYFYKRVWYKDFPRIEDVFNDYRKEIRKSLPLRLRLLSDYKF